MARIRQFTIKGLAGRADSLEVTLNPDVNIFWGLNGTGKTSLLKILHAAMLDDATSIVNVPFQSATVVIESELTGLHTQTIRRKAQSKERRHIEQLLGHGEPLTERQLLLLEEQFQWTTSPELPQGYRMFGHSYLPISRVAESRVYGRPARRIERELADEAAYDQFFAEQITTRWRNYNTDTLVRVRSLQDQGMADILLSVLSQNEQSKSSPQLAPREAYELVRSVFGEARRKTAALSFQQFAKTYTNDPLAKRVVGQIQELSDRIHQAQRPQLRLEYIIRDLLHGSKQVQFGPREINVLVNDETVPLSALSSGEKQVLRILIECLAAGASTVLIDEPELSLHVDWQRKLVECMNVVNPECQLILATHSPEVMADIPDDRIIQL